MISATQNFWDNVWTNSRSLSIGITIVGTDLSATPVVLTQSNIKSFSLDDQLSEDGTLQICNVPMRTLTFTFFDEDGSIQAIGLGGAYLELSLGVTNDPTDDLMVGEFYINEVNRKGMQVTCEAVDSMGFANIQYTPSIQFPAELSDVLDDAAGLAGLTIYPSASTWNNANLIIPMMPTGLTVRQVFQYLAPLIGCGIEAKHDSDKTITQSLPYVTGETIPLGGIYSEEIAESPLRITDVTYKGGDNATGDSTGLVIDIEQNPIIDMISAVDRKNAMIVIYGSYGNIPIYPVKARTLSCPAFQTGDLVDMTRRDGSTFSVLLTHISQSGLASMNVVCAGDTIEKHNYVMGGTLTSRVNNLTQTVEGITDEIEEQSAFIRIEPDTPLISIGKGDARVDIGDDSVTIQGEDGTEAILKSSEFSVGQANFKMATVGNWAWISRTVNGTPDQNLCLKWIGGAL